MSEQALFERLFWYRERLGPAPYENMLSEALAAALNRMPRKEMAQFVADLFLPSDAHLAWANLTKSSRSLRWETEVWTDGKRADLVLKAEATPVLVVENKVNAPLRDHSRSGLRAKRQQDGSRSALPVDNNGEEHSALQAAVDNDLAEKQEIEARSQLHTYGNWLHQQVSASQLVPRWKGAIVFLTHASPPPEDFGGAIPGPYGVLWQRTCRWRQVAAWLEKAHAATWLDQENGLKQGDQRPGWAVLAQEIAGFLKGRKMASDGLTHADLNMFESYFSGYETRLESTFGMVRERIEAEVQGIKFKNTDTQIIDALRAVWGYGYLTPPHAPSKKAERYLCWGICYPDKESDWNKVEAPLSGWPHAFVALAFEKTEFPIWTRETEAFLPDGWRIVKGGSDIYCYSSKLLHEFPSETEALFKQFSDWAALRVREIEPLLREIAKT
ncbi:hypothetical protein [Teichococcus vastitatis]|uniref:hypothetical protein n=1 Tax=Teichococcus vastitatis TaxID=2307076 RepID=UPI0013005E8A|nr:hypothetical protein [Pseudoroseomonas vastitatis]